jgi:hypothetical protein
MTRAMVAIHLILGFALIGILVAIVAVGLVAALRRRSPPRIYFTLHSAAAGLLVLAVLFGLLLLVTGSRPKVNLHLVYAGAALVCMPVVRSLIRSNPARAKWYHLGGSVLLFGLLVRLATTG